MGAATLPVTMKHYRLREEAFAQPSRIDRENGILHGVKVLGRESKNKRTYTRRALEQAAGLYEGVDVMINHSRDKERGVLEQWGVLRNVQVREDGNYADLHFLKTHSLTETILERIERMGDRFGLSHDADGEVAINSGKQIVESIERVRSVDIVRNPATHSSMFESIDADAHEIRTLREIVIPIELTAEGRDILAAIIESDAAYGGVAAGDIPVGGVTPDNPAEMQVKAAFRALINAVIDDESLDAKACLKKIKEILMAKESVLSGGDTTKGAAADDTLAGGAGGGGDDTAKGGKKVTESAADNGSLGETLTNLRESVAELTTKLGGYEKRETARRLLEEASIEARGTLIDELAGLPDEKAMGDRIVSWPSHVTHPSRLRESFRPNIGAANGNGNESYDKLAPKGLAAAVRQ